MEGRDVPVDASLQLHASGAAARGFKNEHAPTLGEKGRQYVSLTLHEFSRSKTTHDVTPAGQKHHTTKVIHPRQATKVTQLASGRLPTIVKQQLSSNRFLVGLNQEERQRRY